MKVGNSSDKSVGSVSTAKPVGEGADATQAKASVKAKGTSATAGGSTVKLSKAASQLLASSSANGDFDAEKVDRVRKSIDDGSYKINHQAIADKLISNAQEVLGGGKVN